MPNLRVLTVGDTSHTEFYDVVETLSRDSLVELVDDADPFELAVVLQSRPGTIAADHVSQLRERMPLAGLVVVLGSWCEGEMRTGQPLPHCHRLFWYQFPAWWQEVRTSWTGGQPTEWQRPDGLLAPFSHTLAGKLVVVDSQDVEAAKALIDAIELADGLGVWQPRRRPSVLTSTPAAGVWVGAQLDDAEQIQLAQFRRALPPYAPLLALLDFPRRDRVEMARKLGATSVLGKPWRAEQVAASLDCPVPARS